jgi:acyl-coenzyme A thioesterase PaaI-like protein
MPAPPVLSPIARADTPPSQCSRRKTEVLTVEYKINLVAPAAVDLEAVGTVVNAGRTLTVCRLEVFGVQGAQRSLVATGQQTLIRVPAGPE